MTRQPCSHRRMQCVILTSGFVLVSGLLTATSAFSQVGGRSDPRSVLRKDPEYPRLYHDGQAFLTLAPEKQEAMRKLHADIAKLPFAERESLKDVLKRYADWLDALPSADREAVLDVGDKQQRLGKIKELREKQWVARLPLATRQYLAALSAAKPRASIAAAATVGALVGPIRSPRPLNALSLWIVDSTDLRSQTIARLKQEELSQSRNWLVAKNFWTELTEFNKVRPTMPTRPAEFGAEVEKYIREYLRPALSKEELARLDKAEGRWPLYPMTLVEIADKHPLALPQRNGPTAFKDLPNAVQDQVQARYVNLADKKLGDKDQKKKKAEKSAETKIPDDFFNAKAKAIGKQRLDAIPLVKPGLSMRFAIAVADFLHASPNFKLPHELWAASPSNMSPTMQAFLDEIGPFCTGLSTDERSQLKKLQGKWPEYPVKVQALAGKYGLKVPWKTLPEVPNKSDFWDYYRLKPQNKLNFPFSPLEKVKRDELQKDARPFDPPRNEPILDVPKGKG